MSKYQIAVASNNPLQPFYKTTFPHFNNFGEAEDWANGNSHPFGGYVVLPVTDGFDWFGTLMRPGGNWVVTGLVRSRHDIWLLDGLQLGNLDGYPVHLDWYNSKGQYDGIEHNAASPYHLKSFTPQEGFLERLGVYNTASALAPLPFRDEAWFKDIESLHLPRLVKTDQGVMIAFFENERKAQADRLTEMRIGRYIRRFSGGALKDEEIERLVARADTALAGSQLQFTTDPDEIEAIYTNGPSSCMSHDESDYEGHCHPVRVYGNCDLALAYLGNDDDGYSGRALVWPDRKVYGGVYGNCSRMELMLQAEGYHRGDFEGARLRLIREDSSYIIMPYLDLGSYVTPSDCGQYLVIEGDGQRLEAHNTSGTTFYAEGEQCKRCRKYTTDDMYSVSYLEHGTENWCEDCHDEHARVCDHSGETVAVNVTSTVFHDGDELRVADWFLHDVYIRVPSLGEYHHTDDVATCPLRDIKFLREDGVTNAEHGLISQEAQDLIDQGVDPLAVHLKVAAGQQDLLGDIVDEYIAENREAYVNWDEPLYDSTGRQVYLYRVDQDFQGEDYRWVCSHSVDGGGNFFDINGYREGRAGYGPTGQLTNRPDGQPQYRDRPNPRSSDRPYVREITRDGSEIIHYGVTRVDEDTDSSVPLCVGFPRPSSCNQYWWFKADGTSLYTDSNGSRYTVVNPHLLPWENPDYRIPLSLREAARRYLREAA